MENTQEDANIEEEHGNGNALKAKASEKVREIREAARDHAGERVRQLTGKAQEQVEGQRERIASKVDQAASGLLQHAEAGDNLRYMAEKRVAHSLESAAGYLHSHHTNEVAGDLSGYVRQHPIRSMIIAGIIGYLLGKLLG
jgi:ElaB/YqjD/DUF883 family membrane-anchored ribosome-binding protein